jgi:alkyl hydroperoxide reductase subunit AhpC
MLLIGKKAPDFTAPAYIDGRFTTVSLASYAGKWLVVMFYPGDFTFVCATEVAAAAENQEAFATLGVEVLTVSVDSPYVHKAWMQQELEKMTAHPVSFPMASDVAGKIGTAYGVYDEAQFMNHRGYFIIDPDGIVQSMLINNPSVGRSYEELFRLLVGLIRLRKNPQEALPCDWMPGEKVLVPSADMVGNIHGVWTTANMSIGRFRKTEGGSIWSSDHLRFDKEK